MAKNRIQKKRGLVLAADISATNTTIAIAEMRKGNRNAKEKINILQSLSFKTKDIKSLPLLLKKIASNARKNYKMTISAACLGIAGPIQDENKPVKMTNSRLMIKKQELIKATGIKDIRLLNDFEIIGYSLNVIAEDKSKITKIKSGSPRKQGTIAIIGAGTGLGMSILIFNKESHMYVPIRSEGGHADFPLEDEFDSKIASFLKKRHLIKGNVAYEDLVSGKGIKNIYSYLLSTKEFLTTDVQKEIKISKNSPELISKYRKDDPICKKTMDKFAIYYARAARNFALESLSSGGLYIAGGIAPKNKELFKSKRFINEFHHSSLYRKVIRKIQIYMITDYRCSIYGAAFAALNAKD